MTPSMVATRATVRRAPVTNLGSPHDEVIWAVWGDRGAVTWTVLAFPHGTASLDAAFGLGRAVTHDGQDWVMDVLFAHRPTEGGATDCPWVDSCAPDAYLESHNRAVLAEWIHGGHRDETVWAALRRIYLRDLAGRVPA